MSPHIHTERRGSVAIVRLDRPPVNALDLETMLALTMAIDAAGQSGAGALLLLGREDVFSAGIDIKAAMAYGRLDRETLATLLNRLVLSLYDAPIPTVVGVRGHAVGGGLVLVLACDLRLVANRVGGLFLPEVRVGIPFPEGALALVRAELGPQMARRLILTDHRLDLREGVFAGIFDDSFAPHMLEEEALREAERLATLPRDVFLATRRQMRGPIIEMLRGTS